MTIALDPIGHVRGGRREPDDDGWDAVEASIALDGSLLSADATVGLDAFSHVTILFHFHSLCTDRIVTGARRPRGRADWPSVGILAQRGAPRPNRLGVTVCRLLSVDGLTLRVRGLDAVCETPVLDVKPHMTGFEPCGPVREPDWAREIMARYW